MPDSGEPRIDQRAIVVGIVILLLLTLIGWFLYTRGVRTTIPPSQPLVHGGKK